MALENFYSATKVMGTMMAGLLSNELTESPPPSVDNAITSKWNSRGTGTSIDLVGSAILFDGKKEKIFVGGGVGQKYDVILGLDDESPKKISILDGIPKNIDDSTTCAVVCSLFPGDSPQSLLIGRISGVYYYPENSSGWDSPVNIWIRPMSSYQTPSSVSVADTNGNGLLDVYIGMHQDPVKFEAFRFSSSGTERSIFLGQTSPGVFSDQTVSKGVGGERNTWTASFVDLNNSGYPDLVVASDEGPPTIYRNNSGNFERVKTPMPVGFWMGLGIGDFTGSGHPSIFMTNVSNNVPMVLMGDNIPTLTKMITGFDPKNSDAKGLTVDHILIINDGETLTPISAAKDSGFGWGAIALPGKRPKIAFAQNWVPLSWQNIPMLRNPGAVGQLDSDGTIIRDMSYPNNNFGITPLVADLRGDGNPYLVWINRKSPVTAYKLKEIFPIRKYVPRTAETSGKIVNGHLVTSGGTGLGSGESTFL
jgi:hypothetical protein